jgi:hypothetical protein
MANHHAKLPPRLRSVPAVQDGELNFKDRAGVSSCINAVETPAEQIHKTVGRHTDSSE